MGSVYKQPKDELEYLPDNYIVYIDKDGKEYDVSWIKNNLIGVHGVVTFLEKPHEGEPYYEPLKNEWITPVTYTRQVVHRGGEPKGQQFDNCSVPVKFEKQSICTALYMPMLIQIVEGTYKPMIESTHKQGHYTKNEIISVICDIKGTKKFRQMRPKELSDFYDDLQKIGLSDDDPDKLGVCFVEKKWNIPRKFLTDACFVSYVMSDKHRNFFTENAEMNGVCVLDKYLWSMNPGYIKVKNKE